MLIAIAKATNGISIGLKSNIVLNILTFYLLNLAKNVPFVRMEHF